MPKFNRKRFDQVIVEIEKVARQLDLPQNIVKEAKELLFSLQKKGFIAGRSYITVALASLYYTMKRDPSCPAISLQNFAEVTPCTTGDIRRPYNKISREEGNLPHVCTLRPTIFVRKFGKEIGLSKEALNKAIEFAREMVRKRAHLGKQPVTLAATCLYVANLVSEEGITQGEITDVCNTAESGIRTALKYPFFVEKRIEYKRPRSVSEEVLFELIQKLLTRPQINQQGIPFYQLRRNLRCSFSDELRGFSIPINRLHGAVRALKKQSLVKTVPWLGCKEKEPDCPCRGEYWLGSWEWPCREYIVQLREKPISNQ